MSESVDTEPQPTTAPNQHGLVRRWMTSSPRWALITIPAMFLGGLLIGGAIAMFTPLATASPSYVSMHNDLAATNSDLRDQASLDAGTITIQQRDIDSMKGDAAAVNKAASDLEAREAAVQAREEAVKAAETQIAANQITDGIVVVGADVPPGVYKTTGGESCYYAFKTGTGSDAEIKDNNIVSGPTTVTLRVGDVFESSRCDVWNRVG